MSFLPLAASALTLGFLHGLGADHLMAIAALAVDGSHERRQSRAIRTAVGFAAGHALILSFGAVAAVTLGLLIPTAISSGAERAGGFALVAMGVFGLWSLSSGRSYGHIHGTSGGTGSGRWHLHLARAAVHPGHSHGGSMVPLVLGALFAVSSLRAVILLQPFTPHAQTLALPALLVLIALFGVGILMSMSLFGVLLARVLSLRTVNAIGRTAAGTVAAASIGLGVYWMVF
jgi:nickel/cobalt exporter